MPAGASRRISFEDLPPVDPANSPAAANRSASPAKLALRAGAKAAAEAVAKVAAATASGSEYTAAAEAVPLACRRILRSAIAPNTPTAASAAAAALAGVLGSSGAATAPAAREGSPVRQPVNRRPRTNANKGVPQQSVEDELLKRYSKAVPVVVEDDAEVQEEE